MKKRTKKTTKFLIILGMPIIITIWSIGWILVCIGSRQKNNPYPIINNEIKTKKFNLCQRGMLKIRGAIYLLAKK